MVIAHGGDVSQQSGGTNRVSAFATGLQRAGHDVTLVVPSPERSYADHLTGVEIRTVDVASGSTASQPVRAVRIARRAKGLATERDATLQFEHSTLGGVGSFLGCSGFVLDMHDLAFASPLYGDLPLGEVVQRAIRLIEGKAVRNAARVVVVSKRMREMVSEEWDVPTDRIDVIPNGYFAETVAGFEDTETVEGRVVFLGTLHPKLDVEAFVEVAQLPEVEEFVVVGDGARREDLVEAKERYGLDTLRIEGYLPDEEAFELVAGAAVAINPQNPSRLQQASSPVKLFYYAALGVPTVVTEGPDAAAELAERGAGRSVPADGPFAETVAEVLRDVEGRREMATAARALAEEWEWSRRSEALVDVYALLAEVER
ncbi:MAG: glycosyltransferase [Haloarculaceae archaeon]